ncbi:hypothetical protein [Pedobacter sp. Leaf176]|uniref:hypothetical protein n=1 Tax=Pedobacter sp. Leaf176 TaxID=1736286 RepID=UPI000AB553E5|nr:hypothetical protein [Pedobacter sp. Leaf176]
MYLKHAFGLWAHLSHSSVRMTFFILGILLMSNRPVAGQSVGKTYVFSAGDIIKRFDPFTKQVVMDVESGMQVVYRASRGQYFTITSSEADGYTIQFWRFSEDGKTQKNTPGVTASGISPQVKGVYIGKAQNGQTFFISKVQFDEVVTDNFRKPSGWAKLEGIVLPVKLRFKNHQPGSAFDFGQSIGIGPAVSFTRNHGGPFGENSFTASFGANVTNVDVDENTMAGGHITSKTTVLGFSPFIGLTLEHAGINFSVMGGMDILTGKTGENWAYRKSPWFGIGIGLSLLSATSKTNK